MEAPGMSRKVPKKTIEKQSANMEIINSPSPPNLSFASPLPKMYSTQRPYAAVSPNSLLMSMAHEMYILGLGQGSVDS